MGQPKLTPLAAAIRAAEQLSDEEKQTLRDVLRPAPKPRSKSKPERKPSQRRKVGKEATVTTDSDNPGICSYEGCHQKRDANVHHIQSHSYYHEFVEPAGDAKGASV